MRWLTKDRKDCLIRAVKNEVKNEVKNQEGASNTSDAHCNRMGKIKPMKTVVSLKLVCDDFLSCAAASVDNDVLPKSWDPIMYKQQIL